MTQRSTINRESYPGGAAHRFMPDVTRPTKATLSHVERLSKNLNRKPTFGKTVEHMVAEYGPVPALVMLMPIAFGAAADFDSIGVEVGHDAPFQTMVHALQASSIGSVEHVGAGDIQSERPTVVNHIYTDKGKVKDGQNSFFIVDDQPLIDSTVSKNDPEKSVNYDQYAFDDGTQYYHAGDAGFFMVYNPSPEIGSTRLSFGNQIPLEMKERLNGELALFDLSNSALSASPIQDGSGVNGFEVVRGGVSPEALKLLLANHSPRRGNATERSIDQAASNGGGQINLMIRVEESTDLQGKPEKIVKFYALGSDSRTLLATKEIHPGGISLATESPKNAMLSRISNSGEQVLLVTPSFPESTPNGYVVWVDENGKVFAGEGYGDKKLFLETESGDGVWLENVSEEVAAAQEIFSDFGFDYSELDFSTNEQGQVIATDAEGNKVYENGNFSLEFAVANAKGLVPTNHQPRPEGETGLPNRPTDTADIKVVFPMAKNLKPLIKELFGIDATLTENSYLPLLLDPETLAYGGVYDADKKTTGNEFLFFGSTESESGVTIIPVMPGSLAEVPYLWVD